MKIKFLFNKFQIAEALDFLSPQVHHHNVCPSSILVTKTGTWKLSGLEFIGMYLLFMHLKVTLCLYIYDLIIVLLMLIDSSIGIHKINISFRFIKRFK